MTFLEFSAFCAEAFAKNALPLPTEAQTDSLYRLTEIMLETNKSMNLTAIKDEKSVILKHYVDSLLVSEHIPAGSTVLDVGCGAGFPTFPLAIFRPDLTITALDSTAKRIAYVQRTAEALGLENVTAIAARAEELAQDTAHRERYDVVTARAVAALPVLSELCLPFARIGGIFLPMKAMKADEELRAASNAICICGGTLREAYTPMLSDLDGNTEARTLAYISKTSVTPKNYPRHFSKISKKPL